MSFETTDLVFPSFSIMQGRVHKRFAKHKHDPNTVYILFAPCHHCLHLYCSYMSQCVVSFSLLLERYARKGQGAENCTTVFVKTYLLLRNHCLESGFFTGLKSGHPKCVMGVCSYKQLFIKQYVKTKTILIKKWASPRCLDTHGCPLQAKSPLRIP